jgi:DNA-binding NarL/FixJ family response regulator
VPRALHHLTRREPQVFTVINRGLANDQIAKPLVVSEAMVKTHVNRILGEAQPAQPNEAVVLTYESRPDTSRESEGACSQGMPRAPGS